MSLASTSHVNASVAVALSGASFVVATSLTSTRGSQGFSPSNAVERSAAASVAVAPVSVTFVKSPVEIAVASALAVSSGPVSYTHLTLPTNREV